ncbi:MFS transporter [Streptomyces sp. M19]
MGSGALVGIAFGAFWTTLTFLLERHYGLGPTGIGLFGLVAAASALASPWAGRTADRLGRRGAVTALVGLVVAGWLMLLPGGDRMGWLIAGVVVLDVGVWGGQAVCQTVLFTLDPATHNRLNTLYFTFRFLGIALGSLAGSLAWTGGGWPAVVCVGAAAALAGLLVGVLPAGAASRGRAPGRRRGGRAPPWTRPRPPAGSGHERSSARRVRPAHRGRRGRTDQRAHRGRRPARPAAARLPADPSHLAPRRPRLTATHTVVLTDLRGYGDSDKPPSDAGHTRTPSGPWPATSCW